MRRRTPGKIEVSGPDPGEVLTRAVIRAAERLAIPQKELARVLGVSASSVSRLPEERSIDPSSKEGVLAVLFLRVYRSLDAVVGGNEEAARTWFHAKNHHLRGVPAELIQTVPGVVSVVEYLDAMRGKI
jgi:uncharacterized protein (DUF2384 family)